MPTPNVIAISYAKNALRPGSRDRERMKEYATVLGEYHVIIFTNKNDNHSAVQQEQNLFLHATNAKSKLGKLYFSIKIGRKIVKANRGKNWTISSQDPFETALAAQLITAGNKNAKLAVQVHGDVFNKCFFENTFFNLIRKMYAAYIIKKAPLIRVVSERIKKSLVRKGVEESKVIILPIQSEVKKFLEVGNNREYRNSAPVTFLYVGRLAKEKNITLLINAFNLLQKKGGDYRLRLLGSGSEEKFLRDRVKKLDLQNKVEFISWSDDVTAEMARADVLCLASNHEGYAMVLVEAMATGLPIVTTDVGCVGEVLQNGKHGLVVPVGDIPAYADAMYALASDFSLRKKIGKESHHTITSSEVSRDKYIENIRKTFV